MAKKDLTEIMMENCKSRTIIVKEGAVKEKPAATQLTVEMTKQEPIVYTYTLVEGGPADTEERTNWEREQDIQWAIKKPKEE